MRVTLNEESQSFWQENHLEYLRYEYDLSPDDLVIDIGAYRGEWAEQIFSRYGCKLIIVEPTPSIWGFPHGDIINKAASTHNGKESFGGAYYYTSTHEGGGQTEYQCFDINSLLAQHDEIALVKINIEGDEYRLLDHILDAGLMNRIRNLQVQFHLIDGESDYYELAGRLVETHKLTWQYPHCWENWRRM